MRIGSQVFKSFANLYPNLQVQLWIIFCSKEFDGFRRHNCSQPAFSREQGLKSLILSRTGAAIFILYGIPSISLKIVSFMWSVEQVLLIRTHDFMSPHESEKDKKTSVLLLLFKLRRERGLKLIFQWFFWFKKKWTGIYALEIQYYYKHAPR